MSNSQTTANHKAANKGFTLVELLVVIAIIAILAAVSVVGYTVFVDQAKDNAALQELEQVQTILSTSAINNNEGFAFDGTAMTFTTESADLATAKTAFINFIKAKCQNFEGTFDLEATFAVATEDGAAGGVLTVTEISYEKDGGKASWTVGK